MLSNIKMPIGEALMTSLIGIITVILILAIIAVLIILVSMAIRAIENRADSKNNQNSSNSVSSAPIPSNMNTGDIELVNTDEKTAAVIMAIVSQKSGIPLNRLAFKSIKLMEDK